MQTLTRPDAARPVKQVTFDIPINPDGPSDADFRIAAERYVRNRVRIQHKDSAWFRVLAVFGLFHQPEAKSARKHPHI